MPAKWQTWMPRQIDAWHGSTFVQFSHPAARDGYAWLLDKQWQSEDCTVPDDQQELSELSGLGAELWEIHGPRILRKFPVFEDGKRRNQVCYLLWSEAKRVFESRQKAAHETNLKRAQKSEAARLRRAERTVTVTPSPHTNRDRLKEQVQKLPPPTPPQKKAGGLASVDRQVAQRSAAKLGASQLAASKGNERRKRSGGPVTASVEAGEGKGHGKSGESTSIPTKNVAPSVKQGVRPTKEQNGFDRRHEGFRSEVFAFWRELNKESPECPWGGGDRALAALLSDAPSMTLAEFRRLLHNRAASEINSAAIPSSWLRKLKEYSAGPLDRFGKPFGGGRVL